MSTPMTPHELWQAFDLWKVKAKTPSRAGWSTHNRHGHGAWGPVNGIILHHTGSDGNDFNLLWDGRSDLPGPLCHWGMTPDGVLEMVGWGRTNHAGMGSSKTLAHVVGQNYSGDLTPGPDDTDGNAHFYGQETMYSGGHPMSAAQLANTLRTFAAICHHHGWSAKSVIGHKEWTGRKVDPGHLDMATFRAQLQALLDAGPGAIKS